MLPHIIDFLVEFLTNINAKKIFGAVLALVGFTFIGRIQQAAEPGWAILLGLAGLLVGGIGFVIIYFDIAKSKTDSGHEATETLTKAFRQQERDENKPSTWDMNQDSDNKNGSQT